MAEVLVTAPLVQAEEVEVSEPKTPTRTPRKTVAVHLTFVKIGEINTLKECFDADVLIRAKWREPELDDQKEVTEIDPRKFWSPKLFVENTIGDPNIRCAVSVERSAEGDAYLVERLRVKGSFMEKLELWEFPFDVQDLSVSLMTELPSSELTLTDDPDEIHKIYKQSFIDEQEWYLYKYLESEKRELPLDRADPDVTRSALTVRCRAARRPAYFLWNMFSVTFLICCLAFVTFAVEASMPQNRLQLSFTLVLTAVAFKFVVNQCLPKVSYLTYLFLICCLAFVTFAVRSDLPHNRLQLSFTLILTAVAFKFVVNQCLPKVSYLTYLDRYILMTMIILALVCFWHGLQTLIPIQDHPYKDICALSTFAGIYVVYNMVFWTRIIFKPTTIRRDMKRKEREYVATVREQAEKSRRGHVSTLKKQLRKRSITSYAWALRAFRPGSRGDAADTNTTLEESAKTSGDAV